MDDIFKAKTKKLPMKRDIFIGVGGNIGDCRRRFLIMIDHLRHNCKLKIVAISPLLQNPPFGFMDQNDFMNCVITIESRLSPNELFFLLKRTEDRFGRDRKFKNAPRTLDLDIIFYKNQKIKSDNLHIPHPFWKQRESVVVPLSYIAQLKQNKIQRETRKMKKKVLIGLSGGIDSSVSAMMLIKDGFDVEGVYMKLHNVSEDYHIKNLETVAKVANHLGIKYHILDIERQFKQEVFDYFVQSYKEGITPNPCVKCNQKIKFGVLFDFMKDIGADFLATGHYAKTDGRFIYEADDLSKDQSYFLAQINKDVLGHLVFPMSKFHKEDIKSMASKLPIFKDIASKQESQEICFVPTVYTDILKEFYPIDLEGVVKNLDGVTVGKHKGYMHYTIGKRRGFTVHGAHDPHFVVSIDPKTNILVVGQKEALAITQVEVNNLNMFIDDTVFECTVKLRYRSMQTQCKVKIVGDSGHIHLNQKVYGVAVGQLAVFYHDKKLIGSGWITKAS